MENVKCIGMFIAIGGASGGGSRTVMLPATQHAQTTTIGDTQDTESSTNREINLDKSLSESNMDEDVRSLSSSFPGQIPPEGNKTFINANSTSANSNSKVLWKNNSPPKIGSSIILSSSNALRYQKWTKEYQIFKALMGPFSIINPTKGLAVTVVDGMCKSGMELVSQLDNPTNERQQFYLGQHGSIFSKICPGLVFDAGEDNSVKLETFRIGKVHLKWKFTGGMIESAEFPGKVIDNDANEMTMFLGSNTTTSSSQTWTRTNTRLLDSFGSNQAAWKQDWKVSFLIDPGNTTLEDFAARDNSGRGTTCYTPNPAFSASFDVFAKGLVITDPANEEQCRKTREQLGFDKDYLFDTEVRDSFHERMCDEFFTGVDHDRNALEGPPQFAMVEYTSVEYEAIEYEDVRYETIDYEEFTRGDDGPALTEVWLPEVEYNPYTFAEDPGNVPNMENFDTGSPNHQNALNSQQITWLNLGHALTAAEHLWDWTTFLSGEMCEAIPDLPLCAPNPVKTVCHVSTIVKITIAYAVLFSVTVAYEVVDRLFEQATLGPDREFYGYQYAQGTYINTLNYNNWSTEALLSIRNNMKEQHTEMKQQLQERHKDIANHVGEDIADAQNALGSAIVDSQNDLGQGIVDAQNALGNYIIEAQNANGQAIVDASNYITLQHNVLSEWLYRSMCTMFKSEGGTCETFIGPLKEDQTTTPVELYWPEGQPTMTERLEQVQGTLYVGATDKDTTTHGSKSIGKGSFPGTSTKRNDLAVLSSQVEEIMFKLDAHSEEVAKTQKTVEEKIGGMQVEMKETKHMMSNLLEQNKQLIDLLVKA